MIEVDLDNQPTKSGVDEYDEDDEDDDGAKAEGEGDEEEVLPVRFQVWIRDESVLMWMPYKRVSACPDAAHSV